ncbi:MAG: hypothetical protein EXS16_03110 [Gemmataceae bacterium]|nr:hypothetical protein [Gemmataceae bacterium]
MFRILFIVALGAGLFLVIAWQLGLLDQTSVTNPKNVGQIGAIEVADPTTLGKDLYTADPYPTIVPPTRGQSNPIPVVGTMNAIEMEEVPSPVPGRVLFIGDQVSDSAVLAAGSTPFLAEPYSSTPPIYGGRSSYTKFYRRYYEGQTAHHGQMLAMIDPSEALGYVVDKIEKIGVAEVEAVAAAAAAKEGHDRYIREKILFDQKAGNAEALGGAKLTKIKLESEHITKQGAVRLANNEKDLAAIRLRQHELRAFLPYKHFTIKSIVRQTGAFVQQQNPTVLVVQNLERLMAEAMIEEPDYLRLQSRKQITATIEPTIIEGSQNEMFGHRGEIHSVAVARDFHIVSASEDKSVCVFRPMDRAPLRMYVHPDPMRVVVCTPKAAERNLAIAGCAKGNLYVWDLDNQDKQKAKPAVKHGDDVAITSLAISQNGKLLASGAHDGSIKLWKIENTLTPLYSFIPAHGVAQGHEDAVTSLHFTPQCRLVSSSRDKSVRVWHLKEKGAFADGEPVHDRQGNVGDLGVSPDGRWMLFDKDRTLWLMSVEERKLVHTVSMAAGATPFDALAKFSPDGSLMLTAGVAEGRLQLWRAPEGNEHGFEVRQFAPRDKQTVSCAAFSPDAGKGGTNSFAVSASGSIVYLWNIPTVAEVGSQRIPDVPLTLRTHSLDHATKMSRIGFEVPNPVSDRYPNGRFEVGRPVTIVIE